MRLRQSTLGFLLILMFVLGLVGGGVAGGATAYWLMQRAPTPEPTVVQVVQPGAGELAQPPTAIAPSPTAPPPTTTPVPSPTIEPSPTLESEPAELPVLSNPDIATMVERLGPATVQVLTPFGTGSGIFISEEGYIVTNAHVVQGANQFAVVYQRGEQVPARLVGSAPDYDIAVLQVDGEVPAVATWGESSNLRLGQTVIAIGSALGSYQNTVTSGILGGVNREIETLTGLLQHDAAINPGNSGGPLLNARGEVIGINTAVVRGGLNVQAEGLGFAVPSDIASSVVSQLIETGQVLRPYMGIRFTQLNSQIAAEVGAPVNEGAYLFEIEPNSPSAAAGLQPGDVILAINDVQLTNANPLNVEVLTYQPGDTVTLLVRRGAEELTITLPLAS